jgi:Cu+-exporting ATPase
VLQLAAAVERQSEHPLARAVVRAGEAKATPISQVSDFQSTTGAGVEGVVARRRVAVGKPAWIAAQGADEPAELGARAEALRRQGKSVVYVTIDGAVAGLLAVSDPVKASTPEAVASLHRLGLKILVLSGDNEQTVRRVAEGLGIDEFAGNVSPEAKHARVEQLRSSGRRVLMAGDGINDAPALAAAEVGVAMGTGTDVAIRSAGVTLVKGDLRGIVNALRLSRATMRNIRQNLFFAFVYNLIGVPLAAGVLYPLSSRLLLNPMIAAAAMSFSSLSVVANSLRLRHANLGRRSGS